MHLLNHPVAAEMGRTGLSFAQTCPFAGVKDFGTLCTCANRADSCPEPTIIGTTHGFNVDLPMLGVKSQAKAFLAKYPNYAYLHNKPTIAEREPVHCAGMTSLVSASLPGCP
eukprot:CAMPEP_0172168834 /NCGR_PEP_ID=MMETSP1050-20130122/10368_1 /TAXON_ID=233186 /ORGANISM="Cryptomonas curvata, Strain CCAP979/52" /LENGTH=111 /DNA_ID=CAMNT_0012839821 /DNA_START=82 /DNA_END=417 /DNA_ORIENTATION=-